MSLPRIRIQRNWHLICRHCNRVLTILCDSEVPVIDSLHGLAHRGSDHPVLHDIVATGAGARAHFTPGRVADNHPGADSIATVIGVTGMNHRYSLPDDSQCGAAVRW